MPKVNPLLWIGLAVAIGAFLMRNRIRSSLVETAERVTRTRRLIAEEEGLRRFAYKDSAGKWTIGIGHLIKPDEQRLMQFTPTNQAPDSLINELFDKDIASAKHAVDSLVKVPLKDSQYAALVSLTFNIGAGAFAGSTVLRRLNAGDAKGAADAILMWNKKTVNGVKVDAPELMARRERERRTFLA